MGRRPHGSSRTVPPSRVALGTGQNAGFQQSQFSTEPRAAPQCFWFSLQPLPSLGQLFVTSEASYSTSQKRKARGSQPEGWAVAWGGWERWPFRRIEIRALSPPQPSLTHGSCKDTQGLWPQFFIWRQAGVRPHVLGCRMHLGDERLARPGSCLHCDGRAGISHIIAPQTLFHSPLWDGVGCFCGPDMAENMTLNRMWKSESAKRDVS